jgi:hypothetical protein
MLGSRSVAGPAGQVGRGGGRGVAPPSAPAKHRAGADRVASRVKTMEVAAMCHVTRRPPRPIRHGTSASTRRSPGPRYNSVHGFAFWV